jgi:hypothetical protein
MEAQLSAWKTGDRNMNRRSFFRGLIQTVVAGAALSVTQEAAAMALGLNKFAEVIRLQQDVIATNLLVKAQEGDRLPGIMLVTEKMDKVLIFAMDHFTGDTKSPEAYAATREIFRNRNLDTLSEEGLREILEVVVPVAVARTLLASHRINFRAQETTTWNRFCDRYQDLILRA